MKIKKLMSAVLLGIASAWASAAPLFVGSWDLYSGQSPWFGNPQVYTGQEAAAFLYGGVAGDYLISTNGDAAADINSSAWYDAFDVGWSIQLQDYRVDGAQLGVYDNVGDSSAMVMDNTATLGLMNYAFRLDAPARVPEPLTIGLMGLGLMGIALARRSGNGYCCISSLITRTGALP